MQEVSLSDVLVLIPLTAIRAAKQATRTIPIVMVLADDPVTTGIVDSLAHLGGNITGLSALTRELSEDHIALLRESFLLRLPWFICFGSFTAGGF